MDIQQKKLHIFSFFVFILLVFSFYILGGGTNVTEDDVMVDTFNTNKIPEEKILQAIYDNFKLQPAQIIEKLELDKPQFRPLASYGHFGRNDIEVKWEELDKVEVLKTYL